MAAPKRILLKLSGEMLGGESGKGFDAEVSRSLAADIAQIVKGGTQLGLVLGGGNFMRGVNSGELGLGRVTADYVGMLGTVMNALAFADVLQAAGVGAHPVSAVPMEPIVPGYFRRKCLHYMNAGEVVIFGCGTGNPFFSTDTAAALRAVEMDVDLLAKATKVDGVYDKDPVKHADAVRYEQITFDQVLADDLRVMDAAATSLCRDNGLPVRVFDLAAPNSLRRLAGGEAIGTLVTN